MIRFLPLLAAFFAFSFGLKPSPPIPPWITLEVEKQPVVSLGATVRTVADADAWGGIVTRLNAVDAGQSMVFTTPVLPADTYEVNLRHRSGTANGTGLVLMEGGSGTGFVDQFGLTGYKTISVGLHTFHRSDFIPLSSGRKGKTRLQPT